VQQTGSVPGRRRLLAGLRTRFGPDAAAVRQGLVALLLNSSTSLVAGAFLGSITGTLAEYPGLLVLVPAAIGLRGNIFGTFGNRISTSMHVGTFRLSARRDTVLGQNLQAAAALTLGMSLLLAVVAKVLAVVFGVEGSISLSDLALVSLVGGLLGSLVVVAGTLALTVGAVRFGWDLDNLAAPIVSVMGDVLTLPALFLATLLLGLSLVTPALAVVAVAVAVAALLYGWRARLPELRRIVRESLPVLLVAGTVSAMAGMTLERSFDSFEQFPTLLILVTPHLSSAGALGGILSGRLSTKLFLGLAAPGRAPSREARRDIWLVAALALPVFLFNGVGAWLAGQLLDEASPALAEVVAISLLAGLIAIAFVVLVAYYGSTVAYRTGLDPDTYGIPVVSSSLDFVGALTLVFVVSLLGIT
jgi:mgtE-like transporter